LALGASGALGASFANGARVASLTLANDETILGQRLAGQIVFTSDASIERDYTVSLQLVGPTGLVAQDDAQSRRGLVPHPFSLPIPATLPGPKLTLIVLLYDPTTGARVPAGAADAITLATLCVDGNRLSRCPA
jgi:hypothetical protein